MTPPEKTTGRLAEMRAERDEARREAAQAGLAHGIACAEVRAAMQVIEAARGAVAARSPESLALLDAALALWDAFHISEPARAW